MQVIGETESLCPVCLRVVPAKKVVEEDNIYLEKSCPEHGDCKILIWRGVDLYKDSSRFDVERTPPQNFLVDSQEGCPYDCGPCPKHRQHVCIAVLEITNRCNLRCPVCFAGSNERYRYEPDLDTIKGMYETIVRYVEKPIDLQISGGEPTVRDDLPDIIALGKEMGIDYIELNTNGIRLARDIEYFRELKESGVDALYFSFDGLTDEVYRQTNGVDLLDLKLKALKNAAELEVGVILVPVIIPKVNYDQIGDIIQFAKKWIPTVVGVHFQPVSYFGRFSCTPKDEDRVTIPDILNAIEIQTGGELKIENFTPTSCPNVHCDARNYSILMGNGMLFPLTMRSRDVSANVKDKDVARKTRRALKDLWKYPKANESGGRVCECVPGSWMELLQRAGTHYLTVSVMAFQDVWTIELERVLDCCIYEVTPDKRLIPFCLFNLSSLHGETLYRHGILSKFAIPTP